MLPLLALAFALSMDAFAVSLVRASTGPPGWLHALELGFAFGLAQGLMPLIGWVLGDLLDDRFRAVDHWIAFLLLAFLGWRMLSEALSPPAEEGVGRHGRLLGLLIADFATSVDAAAAGLTLPLFGFALPIACLVIGTMTGLLCFFGYLTVSLVGSRAARTATASRLAELAGRAILILIGLRILISHLLE